MIELTTFISNCSRKTATILLDPDEDAMHPYQIRLESNFKFVDTCYAGTINAAEAIAEDFVRG
jgi:hypothetical protein